MVGPIIATRMHDAIGASEHASAKYAVVSCSYSGANRVFGHRTLKAAFHTLGSVANSSHGKLHRTDEFAACVKMPDGTLYSWTEVRNLLEEGAP